MKETQRGNLQTARDAVVWKLEGLSECDIRRPLVPSGTNLLGIVKHQTSVELVYFGPVSGRPMGQTNLWFEDGLEDNADLYARADEASDGLISSYRASWVTSDATIGALDLDAKGAVPWWNDPPFTRHHVLVHVMAETFRRAGHADLVRELIDGSIGYAPEDSNGPDHDSARWRGHREQVERDARRASR